MRGQCKLRRRWFAFGFTPRTIWLLVSGLALALPGFFNAWWGLGMIPWDALVLAAAFFDWLRLPAAYEITVGRSWSNAPSSPAPPKSKSPWSRTAQRSWIASSSTICPKRWWACPLQGACVSGRACAPHCATKSIRATAAMSPRVGVPALPFVAWLIDKWAMAPLQQTVARVSRASAR